MLTEKYRAARPTTDTHHKNSRRTLRHRSYRHRERRTKRRERATSVQLTNTSFFENSLLPHLSTLFKRMFHDLPEHERDDAEQDCLCQSWLEYKRLPAPIAVRLTAEQLAMKVYRAYQRGGRFIVPT